MARPAQLDKRRDLARQAVTVLAAKGLDLPFARLAEELGVKRPTLLYHFPTKSHIVEAALEDLLTEQAAYVLTRIEQHSHPIDRLYAQVRAVHAFHHGREERIVMLSQAIAAGGGRMQEIVDIGNRVFEAHRKEAARRLREGVAQGTVWPCDADALVNLVRSVIDGLMVQRVMTQVDLTPIHEFLWQRVLAPLKRNPEAS
ncbi:MAG: TetR/AcrR family transcriptional regulator [Myxococcales bacterium]|nr:TetR/AcrR family transcriptional regulator [Myxococcales bacterium]MCB9577903.1 TetR/AcrR family transcriptional regulator [Polyangiaceae bacterium]